MPKRCWKILVFGHASNGGQRPSHETTDAPIRQVSSELGRCKKYFTTMPLWDPSEIFGRLAMNLSFARETEWSGRLNASQREMPRGLGGVGGAALSKRGSTVDAQEDCTPVIHRHAPAILSP